ncbi:MAG: NAD(P)/FAD-dependent oxidoreductase [Candidatus Omnitrophica bacterium]|nr:NAD(P)/FAD-dependent oxidoreductase [Candidatus Omnitrophota bacterium]
MGIRKKIKSNNKIVIVGAGPTGCYLGQILKAKGFDPLLIEEHKEIGRPVHCAGLVGEKVFKEAKIPVSSRGILNTINGATIHLGDEAFTIRKDSVAYVVDREIFDKNLGKDLNILLETKFIGLEKENGRYVIETDKGEISADIVIGADGASSMVREFVVGKSQSSQLKGVQFRMAFKPAQKDLVEVYIKRPYFYWIIPESERVIRVGVISQNPYQDLQSFVKRQKINGEIIEKFAGTVPLNYYKALSREKVFLVGDSAAQTKPLTYGGIYMGMRGAEILAECIIEKKFSNYSSLWMQKFGRELKVPLKARRIFQELSDKDVKRIFSFARKNIPVIERKGDFEHHSALIWELLRNPDNPRELTAILFKILKANLRSN